MKCLIINCSPRPESLTRKMMSEAASYLESKGVQVVQTDIYEQKIEYCKGCCACRTFNRCVLPHDAAHEIGEQIRQSDMLVIGTPTYWGGMSSKLKTLLDRLVYVFAELPPDSFPKPKLKGLRAVTVATCSTPYPFNILFSQSRGAVRQINEVLKTAGCRTTSIQIAGTMHLQEPPARKIAALRKAIDKFTKKR